jgi:hypothetical protein
MFVHVFIFQVSYKKILKKPKKDSLWKFANNQLGHEAG